MSKIDQIFGPDAKPGAGLRRTRPKAELERARRRIDRESGARLEAERRLEEKSRELFKTNLELKGLNDDLERIVRQRTEALQDSIARIEQQQKHAEHTARHDALTGLPNRRFVTEHLDKDRSCWRNATLLYIDLDRFKHINDTLGHTAGDAVLKEMAERLKSYAPENAIIARLGGDELVVVVPNCPDGKLGAELAETIVERLPDPIPFEGNILRFDTSVGVASNHSKHLSHEDLMIDADLALYRAKEAGRGCSVFFTEDMRESSRKRKSLSDDLIAALEERQIRPAYQPRICTRTGRMACVEALARWYHPEHGAIAPAMFLSIAEDIGRLAEIDGLILRHALQDLVAWEGEGVCVPHVSLNVSGRRLMQPDLTRQLDNLQIPKGRLSFELLESVFFDPADRDMLDRLDAIRARSIRIEIDDFGSGHASINGLLAVRPDALKIDRNLVGAALGDWQLVELLKAVVKIGKALDIDVIAEGVETVSQIEMCKALGCDQLQGYGILGPVPTEGIVAFARSNQTSQ